MRMLYPLQQDHFIVHHSLVALDIFFENNLDSILFPFAFSLADDPVGAGS